MFSEIKKFSSYETLMSAFWPLELETFFNDKSVKKFANFVKKIKKFGMLKC